MTKIELLYFAALGLACGILVRDRSSKLLGNLIVGVMGAIPGGWLFKWANLFPYGPFVGALMGATFFVGLKRAFSADIM